MSLSPVPVSGRWVRLRLTWRSCPLQGAVGRKQLPHSCGGEGPYSRPPLLLWQWLSHKLRQIILSSYWIVTKWRGVFKCSNLGQTGWFCSPSILVIMWDQSLPACDNVYIHYNVIIWYRELLKVSLSPGGFLLNGRKVRSENVITLLSLYMPTTSQSPFWSPLLSLPSAHPALHLLKQQVTAATHPIRAYYAVKLHCF